MQRRDARGQDNGENRNGESRRGREPEREQERRREREHDQEHASHQGHEGDERQPGGQHRGRDPERDRYAEPRGRELGRGDRDFRRDERGGYGPRDERDLGGRDPRERWEMGGWEAGPRRFEDDDRGERSYGQYGEGAYGQGGYNQGGYNPGRYSPGRYSPRDFGPRDHGPRDYGRRDFGESGYGQRDFGPGNYGRGGIGEGSFGHYGEASRDLEANRRNHHGLGPRGYKRSDERIREDVCDCLMRDPEIDASEIEVQVADGVVTLEGTVESRHIKHVTENLCDSIPGVQDVTNHLRIERPEGGSAVTPARRTAK